MNSLVGLFTDVLPAGGIQRAGRHVAAVAAKVASDRGMAARFLSLYDPQGLHTVRVGALEFSASGYAGSKVQFALAALRAAGRKPALVIALHPHLAPVVWGMSARARKFRSMVFSHGVEVWQPLGWPRGAALRKSDLVIGPSSDTVQHLISDQHIPPGKVQKLPWGLDPEFEARMEVAVPISPPPGFPRAGRIILTVGRWDTAEKYKGADTLIAALPAVLKTATDASLVLVGDGNDRPRLERLARDLGVLEHTHFLFGLSPDQLFACYARCDIFALPSGGEGFGLVFLEAMANAKPVIGGRRRNSGYCGRGRNRIAGSSWERRASLASSRIFVQQSGQNQGNRRPWKGSHCEGVFLRAISNKSDQDPGRCSSPMTKNS